MSLTTPPRLKSPSAPSSSSDGPTFSPFVGSAAASPARSKPGQYDMSSRITPMEVSSGSVGGEESPPDYSPDYPHQHQHPSLAQQRQWQHLYVLPVLLLEFLALALTRAVLPSLLLAHYGDGVYIIMGMAECVRGLLAFVSCPLFGRVSDIVGRRICLFVTVAGTCAPVCSLALLFGDWDYGDIDNDNDNAVSAIAGNTNNLTLSDLTTGPSAAEEDGSESFPLLNGGETLSPSSGDEALQTLHPHAITIFVILLALSGIFSSTFTIVFAYISDTVRARDERVSAYGLALATFGLSFTIGPMAGGYISQSSGGKRYVFACSFVLTVLDLLYIYAVLPESRFVEEGDERDDDEGNDKTGVGGGGGAGASSLAGGMSMLENKMVWSPLETLRLVLLDPFLRRVGQVAFLYYTSLWAVVSTLVLYAAKRFEMGPERLGELMSALGLSTMIAEAVLVRIVVPMLGEKRAMRMGLAAFALQCVVLGFAYEPWHLFICAAFSLLGNLVYPSLSSLVSGSVEPEAVGEALGAINGIKALTEGVGPLVFGSLMTISERSALPGWPYLLAALLAYAAYRNSGELPDTQDDEDYVHELDRKHASTGEGNVLIERWMRPPPAARGRDDEEEHVGLLDASSDEEENGLLSEIESEIDESEDTDASPDLTRLPTTFASFLRK